MHIYLWGQRTLLGAGIHYANFSDAMKRLTLVGGMVREVDVCSSNLKSIADGTEKDDIHILFASLAEPVSLQGSVIKWGVFESNILSTEYVHYLKKSHAVWVPSSWARDVLIHHGLSETQVDVVPEGVDAMVFNPLLRESVVKDHYFRFFMCGKYEKRKGYDELLKGFYRAFSKDVNVKLYLKPDNFSLDKACGDSKGSELRRAVAAQGLQDSVVFIEGRYSAHDLALLNSYCDAQIFPSRAEGWGLPLIEGLATGLPTISNYYSGHTEYLGAVKQHIACLDYETQLVEDLKDIGRGADGAVWAVANPDSIAANMLAVRDNPRSWRSKALKASEVIRAEFSWENSVVKAVLSLKRRSILNLKIDLAL